MATFEHPVTNYAESDGLSIAYQVWGDGELNLVLIPGIVSHLEYMLGNPSYVHWLRSLAETGRLAVFDKRGNGMSDRIDGAPTIEERMRDIEAVMDASRMEHATLIGFSEGCAMAIAFAAMRPERVERLVLCGGYAAGRRVRGDIDDETLERVVAELRANWGTPDGRHVFSAFGPDPADDEAYSHFVREQRMSATPSTIAALFRMAAIIDVRSLLPMVRAPTLVVHREDEVNNERVARPIVEGIADAIHKILPGTHHIPYDGDTDAYVAVIHEFVTGSAPSVPAGTRALSTVLFTDLVKSTEMQSGMGDTAWRRLLNRHDEICTNVVARFRGKLVKFTGDGMLATFDAPTNAVACALTISESILALELSCRCGIHTGEIELRGDDVSGLGINIAARIMDRAEDGQVLASDLTRQLMLGSSFRFEARGEFALRGLPEEWRLFQVFSG